MVKSLTGTASVHHSVNHISPRPAMKSDGPQLFTRFSSPPPSPHSLPQLQASQLRREKIKKKTHKRKDKGPVPSHAGAALLGASCVCVAGRTNLIPLQSSGCGASLGHSGILQIRVQNPGEQWLAERSRMQKQVVLLGMRHCIAMVLSSDEELVKSL